MTEKALPEMQVRSNFVPADDEAGDPFLDPCDSPKGQHWVYARAPDDSEGDATAVGKWLVFCGCRYITPSWGTIRDATLAGELGIASKVSTHWHRDHDPAARDGWADHVICIYTADYRDQVDVLRVARGLRDIGVVAKMKLNYKPDATTYAGKFKGNAAGEIAIYSCGPPYDRLIVDETNLSLLRAR